MKFRTELKNYEQHRIIDYSKKILCIGSCFAENIHRHLQYLNFKSFLNPCGITYNPISIANSIYYLLGRTQPHENDIIERHARFSHYDFHSDFSAMSKSMVMVKIREMLGSTKHFDKPDILILSLGSAYTYFRKDNNEAVNNCHKMPSSTFEKRLLSVEQVSDSLKNAINELRDASPGLEVIITVSPVRHLRDGIIQNNLSKSTLLLAVSQLESVTYFPSYELLLDDLRDYRFYAEDLTHPSMQAVKYILNFFTENFFSDDEKELRKKVTSLKNALSHRPFYPESSEHKSFLSNLLERAKTIHNSSVVDLTAEIADLEQQIRNK